MKLGSSDKMHIYKIQNIILLKMENTTWSKNAPGINATNVSQNIL